MKSREDKVKSGEDKVKNREDKVKSRKDKVKSREDKVKSRKRQSEEPVKGRAACGGDKTENVYITRGLKLGAGVRAKA